LSQGGCIGAVYPEDLVAEEINWSVDEVFPKSGKYNEPMVGQVQRAKPSSGKSREPSEKPEEKVVRTSPTAALWSFRDQRAVLFIIKPCSEQRQDTGSASPSEFLLSDDGGVLKEGYLGNRMPTRPRHWMGGIFVSMMLPFGRREERWARGLNSP